MGGINPNFDVFGGAASLPFSAILAFKSSGGPNQHVILTGDAFLPRIESMQKGEYLLWIQQDSTGSRLLTFDISYQFTTFPALPVLSTTPFAIDVLRMSSKDNVSVQCELIKGSQDTNQLIINLQGQDLVGVNDDPISTWKDFSGNNNDFTGTGATRPLIDIGGINGIPVAKFDGADSLTGPALDLSTNNGAFSLFKVIRTNSSIALSTLISQLTNDNQARFHFIFQAAGDLIVRVFETDVDFIGRRTNTGEITTSTSFVLNANFSGGTAAGNLDIYKNNTQVDTSDNTLGTFNGLTPSTTLFCLGAQIGGGEPFFTGDMGEILMMNRLASVNERNFIAKTLGAKYGITVA